MARRFEMMDVGAGGRCCRASRRPRPRTTSGSSTRCGPGPPGGACRSGSGTETPPSGDFPAGWGQVLEALGPDPDLLTWRRCCSTRPSSGRTRTHAAAAGYGSKFRVAAGRQGWPLKVVLTGGERHGAAETHALLDGLAARRVVADRAYDADHIREAIRAAGAEAVIPPRQCRREMIPYDRAAYR